MKQLLIKKLLIALPIVLFGFSVLSQEDVPFDKKAFPDDQKEAFKEAAGHLKDGDKYYESEPAVYSEALTHYLKANDFNPDNAVLNYRMGRCYLKTVMKTKCVSYLEKAYQINPLVAHDVLYLIARGYQLKLESEKAIELYEEYKGSLSPDELKNERDRIDKKIAECKVAIKMVNDPVRIFSDNLGPAINTEYLEYGPYINADETLLMFTSARESTTGGKIDPNYLKYYEDIYISEWIDGKWTRAENPGKPLNRDNNDAIVGVSPDGKHALIFMGENNGGDLYECRIIDGEWRNPRRLPNEINTKYHESAASFSPDMDGLYFVSDKPGGFGGKDIYYTELRIKGNREKLDYNDAVNLGAVINTPEDENGVFMGADGETLYFSSKGHETMGGYDIFKSTRENGKWSKPENMGYPINTPDNDYFFSISSDGKHAYYSSFDPAGYGNLDLYMITLLGPEKPLEFIEDYDLIAHKTVKIKERKMIAEKVEIQESQITIIRGRVLDALTLEPLGGVPVEIYDNLLGMMIYSFESKSQTGEYMVSVPSGKNYGFSARARDYMFHSENLIIPPAITVQEINLDIRLHKVKVGSRIILKNIFFDFNKATIRSESTAELNRLVKMLNDVPSMTIEISGHTDNVGSVDYNKKLSGDRARSVVNYLINKGIKKERLSAAGYGESQPLESNDTEKGRQMNRRTEFKVLSK